MPPACRKQEEVSMKKRKKGPIILLCVLGVLMVAVIGLAGFLMIGQNIKNATIRDVDVANVPDGVYQGEGASGRFRNRLEVTVSGGRITDIQILKDMVVAIPEISSQLFSSVIDRQSIAVDAASGATVTTKAYEKAMEDALSGE
jgi:uncharacterized protein with FMN-binding domain